MLFIYGALTVGGIETFFVRMAKERDKLGLETTILLLSKPEKSNSELLVEMGKYSTVIFPKDLFYNIPGVSRRFPLLAPINKKKLYDVFNNVDQIHAFDGMHALLGYRLSCLINKKIPITVGFYHYIKYLWGGQNIALHERINRKFVFEYLPKKSLLFFSEGNRNLYTKHKKMDFSNSNTFRLGVVDNKIIPSFTEKRNEPLKIVAVGRLVEFKTYNLYMLDVIKSLLEKGRQVQFCIYGDGPLRTEIAKKIYELGLTKYVFLKGTLDYSEFDEVVSQYDLFIGSGTAIIQAASLGVSSIVGVENVVKPVTYGFFCDVNMYEYNLQGLDLPMVSVEYLIERYMDFEECKRIDLKKSHMQSIKEFTNKACQESMDELKNIQTPHSRFNYNMFSYEVSRVFDRLNMKFNKQHPFNKRHHGSQENV